MASEHMQHVEETLKKAIDNPEEFNENIEVSGLMARLVQANYNDYANTAQMLIESLQKQKDDLSAELSAIRHRVNYLFSGDFMPTQEAIIRAMYPSVEMIQVFKKRYHEED